MRSLRGGWRRWASDLAAWSRESREGGEVGVKLQLSRCMLARQLGAWSLLQLQVRFGVSLAGREEDKMPDGNPSLWKQQNGNDITCETFCNGAEIHLETKSNAKRVSQDGPTTAKMSPPHVLCPSQKPNANGGN